MLNFETIKQGDGSFAYKVESPDGLFRVFQRWTPGVGGKVPMTEAEAEANALALIAAVEASAAAVGPATEG